MDLITGLSSVHADVPMTSFSQELPLLQGLIGHLVVPSHKVNKESNTYHIFERVAAKDYSVERAMGAEAKQFKLAMSSDSYTCKEYAVEIPLPKRMLDDQDDHLDLIKTATIEGNNILSIRKEVRSATLIQTAANWDGTAAVPTNWDDAAATIEADMDAATQAFMLQSGTLPNTVVISFKVYRVLISWLRSAPSAMSYGDFRHVDFAMESSGIATQLSGLFGINRWLVGMQLKDTADVGDDFSGAYIWNDNVTLLYIGAQAGLRSKTAAKCFDRELMTVRRRYSDSKDSLMIRSSHIEAQKITGSSLGYVLTNIL